VPLSPLSDPGLIVSAIVQTLVFGKRVVSRRRIAQEESTSCAKRTMLFLLDNFEHLIQAAPIVAELLLLWAESENSSDEPRSPSRYTENMNFLCHRCTADARSTPSVDCFRVTRRRTFCATCSRRQAGFGLARKCGRCRRTLRAIGWPALAIELAAAR